MNVSFNSLIVGVSVLLGGCVATQEVESDLRATNDLDLYHSVWFAMEDEAYSRSCRGQDPAAADRYVRDKYATRMTNVAAQLRNQYGETEVEIHSINGLSRRQECIDQSLAIERTNALISELELRLRNR